MKLKLSFEGTNFETNQLVSSRSLLNVEESVLTEENGILDKL